MNSQDLALRFSELSSLEGYDFDFQPIPGEANVLQVSINEMAELPVFISVTETQILCIIHLWTEGEIKQESRVILLETMLSMNIPVPLSSFAKIDDRYIIFGALAKHSSFDDVVHEVVTLVENAVDAIDAMANFLN